MKAIFLSPGDLQDADRTQHALRSRGLSPKSAAAKAALFSQCAASLAPLGAPSNARLHAFVVPGRVEMLGKHTDYAGGRSLLVAAERGFCAVAIERPDHTLRLLDAQSQEQLQFPLDPALQPPLGHWSNYPMTVARRLCRNFPGPLRGADVAFASDLPPAAGMSSSSAMIVLFYLILDRINSLSDRPGYRRNIPSPEALAGYLGTVENGQSFGALPGDKGVGTFGGSEDHTAILCCQPGQASQYAFCPVQFERRINLPPECLLAIGVSGIVAEKTGAAREQYNRASRLTTTALRLWNTHTRQNHPHLSALLQANPDALAQMRQILAHSPPVDFTADELLGRIEQFAAESQQIIPAAGDALRAGDLPRFGQCVDQSQHLAERFLGNQIPQTIELARRARDLGALAASAFGAGFGGSVWALVRRDDADAFLAQWQADYRRRFPAARAAFFLTRPGPAAFAL